MDHSISNKKKQQSASDFREPQLHAAKSFQRKRPLADDRVGKYRKIRILSPPNDLLTGEKIVSYSRLPHDDELYVMRTFARHASQCSICAHPYVTYLKGDTLCSIGHQRALDVAQYVFNKAGQTFSVVDLDGNRRVQMEIPADCVVVRELLKAVERGLRLPRKVPTMSYDTTHPIPPGIIQPTFEHQRPQEPRSIRKPRITHTLAKAFSMEKTYDIPIWQAGRATSVAPTCFTAPEINVEYADTVIPIGDESNKAN